MKLAFISDIHGNQDALKSVLEHISANNVDKVVCLGDVVGYGPEAKECIDLLIENGITSVIGNHEEYIMGKAIKSDFNDFARTSLELCLKQLADVHLQKINQFKPYLLSKKYQFKIIHSAGIRVENFYVLFKQIKDRLFELPNQSMCFVGHTHKCAIFELDDTKKTVKKIEHASEFFLDLDNKRYIINAGSVGQPRDQDTRSSYIIYNSDSKSVSVHRVKYDIECVRKKMTKLCLPSYLINRLNYGN